MNPDGNLPIGIFDSGIGGLTVARAVSNLLPRESIIYFGDTARVPYGSKSATTINSFARQNTRFLIGRKVKLIIVACNTASAVALPDLEREFDIPIIGVIQPGARAAATSTGSGSIAVIGTRATIDSHSYREAITAKLEEARVLEIASPLLVPLVEEGWLDHQVTRTILAEYLGRITDRETDTLVLGCTHYPLLASAIKEVLPDGINIVDSARETAAEVATHLDRTSTAAQRGSPGHQFFVSDLPQRFREMGKQFFGGDLDGVERIDIEEF
ncbi:glutamate racemase [candidate division KSB1 bacterium]